MAGLQRRSAQQRQRARPLVELREDTGFILRSQSGQAALRLDTRSFHDDVAGRCEARFDGQELFSQRGAPLLQLGVLAHFHSLPVAASQRAKSLAGQELWRA